MKTIVIIGGGISGLASAALLGKLGWKVIVLEKNTTLGGRARVLRKKGFTFDMGPSWYLMPEVFENFFAEFQKKPSDFFELIRLKPRYQVVFGDAKPVVIPDGVPQTLQVFESIEPESGKTLQQWLVKMERAYEAVVRHLLLIDIWKVRTWLHPEIWRAAIQVFTALRPWDSWSQEVNRHFRSTKLRQILGFPAVFLGGSPFNTPSFYAILAWADMGKGVWHPRGGMGQLIEALEKLARDNGAEIHTSTEVTAIEVEHGNVVAVRTDDQRFATTTVVAATDIPHVEMQLLPSEYREAAKQQWSKKDTGISALMLYLGINKKLPKAAHHTLAFSEDWEANFEEILNEKQLPSDPSLYLSIPTVTDKSMAPKNHEEIIVLVPLGAGTTYAPQQMRAFTQRIIQKVERVLGEQITNHLLVKEVFTPEDFAHDYHAFQGTALGLAHTLRHSLWLRSRNKHPKIHGLFYAGQYTNPGVGVPMALLSAQLVAQMIGPGHSPSETIFRNGSTTYYYSSIFFQGQVKTDVFDLYAYVRTLDNLVDSPEPQPELLDSYWQLTMSAWHGQPTTNTIIQKFVDLAKRRGFEWKWVEAFVRAMKQDLTKTHYHSRQELDGYIFGSAEVIGFMMAKILGLPKEAMPAAALQGKAMQLLNFIRDVHEDKLLGRNYLGYTEREASNPQLWKEFINTQIARYWELQREAEKGYRFIPKKYLIPIKTAAQMYQWTALQIFKDPQFVWRAQVKPRKGKVLIHLLKNMIEI